jgi:D-apionolactonase
MSSTSQKLTGTTQPASRHKALKAGPVTAILDNGGLRSISYRGTEVVRGLYFLARNTDWGTYTPIISKLKVSQSPHAFSVTYQAVCTDEKQELHVNAEILADAKGTVIFRATGTPKTPFVTNRTGFIVLHPLHGIIGRPVKVEHTDGTVEKTTFPKRISPGQPIFWIRSLKHQVMPGVTAEVRMEGDAFEMEDHRNWMDASYKTYVHSLLDEWPYTLQKGKTFDQSITLTFAGKPQTKEKSRKKAAIKIAIGKPLGRMPAIGSAVPAEGAQAAISAAKEIAAMNLANLVCQLDGNRTGLARSAKAFAELSKKTGIPIKLELILPAKAPAIKEVETLAEIARNADLNPQSIVVTHMHDLKSFQPKQSRPWGPEYDEMSDAVRKHFPGKPVGGGMLSYFTELNRKPLIQGVFDFATHTVCPIVHAADDLSVMETLEALPSIFDSARAMIGKTPYHLGPSGISARDNPYGKKLTPNPDRLRTCLANNDPRERGTFAAAWLLGLAAASAKARLNSLALGALTGAAGMIESDAHINPAYHLVKGIAELSGARILETTVTDTAKVVALAVKRAPELVIWCANKTDAPQDISLEGFKGKAAQHEISARTYGKLSRQFNYLSSRPESVSSLRSVELPAYSVMRFVIA